MKLVNIHKHILLCFLLMGYLAPMQAQEIWSLDQCIDTALIHNKNLQMSRNDQLRTAHKKLEIQSDRRPKLSANTDYKYFIELPHQSMPMSVFDPTVPKGVFQEAQFGVPHNIDVQLQMMVPIYDPKMKGAIEGADIARDLAEINHKKSEEELIYELTLLYYNIQILMYQLDFISDNEINTKKLLANIRLLYEQQMARRSDVDKIQLQLDQLSTARDKANNHLSKILDVLKLNIGLEFDRDITIEKEVRLHDPRDYPVRDIFDYKLLMTQNKLLHNEFHILSRAGKLPTISGIGSYGLNGFGYDRSPNSFLKFHPIGFLGVQASYPVYDGRLLRHKKQQKKLEIQNNELRSSLLLEKNKVERENARRERTTSLKIISDTEAQIELARKVYDHTLLQQKQGTANLSEVLMADHALREVQQNYLSTMVDYLKADLELRKLSGELSIENNE